MGDKKFHLATFGCRTNQADSAALRDDFLSQGYLETLDWRQARVIVVNSCTVTHRSDQQVRQLARKFSRGNPGARIIVTGCYAQRDPQQLARIPGVGAVVGNTHKHQLVEIAGTDLDNEPVLSPQYDDIARIYRDDFQKVRALDSTAATQPGARTRPFVKIQDGCDSKCSYCIIPLVRGPSRSVPPGQILQQVRELVELGFKEVVLTGIHLGTYGRYLEPRYSLDRLLARMTEIPGLARIRLSSIEPMELSRRVLQLAAESDKFAPHFHICLQSGSDSILKRMQRPYSISKFERLVSEIHSSLPDAAIGTDVIVGFPGETDEDYEQTRDFVQRMPFTYLHVFPYSDRPGTKATQLSQKVDPQVKQQRGRELRQISEEKNRAFRRRFLGQRLSVLTLTEHQAGMRDALSANYLRAQVPASVPANQIIEGLVIQEQGNTLVLRPIS